MENKTINHNGIGFTGLLTIAFIILKLCGVINWSWVWVLAPMWISILVSIVLILLVVICKLISSKL